MIGTTENRPGTGAEHRITIQVVSIAILTLFFTSLSASIYRALDESLSFDGSESQLTSNLYTDYKAPKIHRLEAEIAELKLRLDFMVFANERRKIQSSLVTSLRSQLNLAPLRGFAWRDMAFALEGVDQDGAEVLNALIVASVLDGWNRAEGSVLLNRCVTQAYLWIGDGRALCKPIADRLLTNTKVAVLARKAGVSPVLFTEYLDVIGVDQTRDEHR